MKLRTLALVWWLACGGKKLAGVCAPACSNAQVCVDGTCRQAGCLTNSECSAGKICSAEQECVDPPLLQSTGPTGPSSPSGPSNPNVVAPTLTGAQIDATSDVRQGRSGAVVVVTGTNFEDVTGASLTGVATLAGTITSRTATSLTFTVDVPHGAALGDVHATLSNSAGTATGTTVLHITAITAAKRADADDTTGLGTPAKPFSTMTKALSVAGTGDLVHLEAGTYVAGETWVTPGATPIGSVAKNVPAGVTLEGEDSATLLQPPAGQWGLHIADSAVVVRRLRITGTARGIVVSGGQVLVDRVELDNNSAHGLFVQAAASAATVTVTHSNLHHNAVGFEVRDGDSDNGLSASTVVLDTVHCDSNSNRGVMFGSIPASIPLASPSSTLTIRDGTIANNAGFGLVMTSRGALSISQGSGTPTNISDNGNTGLLVAGDGVWTNGNVTIANATFFGNVGVAIKTQDSTGVHNLSLSGVSFQDNLAAIVLLKKTHLVARNTALYHFLTKVSTVELQLDASADFGTSASTGPAFGDNLFEATNAQKVLLDNRPASQSLITVSASRFVQFSAADDSVLVVEQDNDECTCGVAGNLLPFIAIANAPAGGSAACTLATCAGNSVRVLPNNTIP